MFKSLDEIEAIQEINDVLLSELERRMRPLKKNGEIEGDYLYDQVGPLSFFPR